VLGKVVINGVTVAYSLEGDPASPVVVFSNGLAADQSMWAPQAASLLRSYRVLRYDTRGHGGTAATPGDYSIALLAQDLLALIDTLGLHRVHFVGLSLGGMVGQLLGIDHGSRLLSLTLCATMSDSPTAVWATRVEAVRKHGVASVADATIERWFTRAYELANPDMMVRMRAMVINTSQDGYAGCAAAIRDMKLAAGIGAIKVPTLVIAGAQDTSTPLPVLETIADSIAGAQLVTIADAAHMPNLEKPAQVTDAIEGFLSRLPRDAASAPRRLSEGPTR